MSQVQAAGNHAGAGLMARAGRLLAGLGTVLNASRQSEARMDEITRLNRLDDAALAARGLRRDGIVQHVFRDLVNV